MNVNSFKFYIDNETKQFACMFCKTSRELNGEYLEIHATNTEHLNFYNFLFKVNCTYCTKSLHEIFMTHTAFALYSDVNQNIDYCGKCYTNVKDNSNYKRMTKMTDRLGENSLEYVWCNGCGLLFIDILKNLFTHFLPQKQSGNASTTSIYVTYPPSYLNSKTTPSSLSMDQYNFSTKTNNSNSKESVGPTSSDKPFGFGTNKQTNSNDWPFGINKSSGPSDKPIGFGIKEPTTCTFGSKKPTGSSNWPFSFVKEPTCTFGSNKQTGSSDWTFGIKKQTSSNDKPTESEKQPNFLNGLYDFKKPSRRVTKKHTDLSNQEVFAENAFDKPSKRAAPSTYTRKSKKSTPY